MSEKDQNAPLGPRPSHFTLKRVAVGFGLLLIWARVRCTHQLVPNHLYASTPRLSMEEREALFMSIPDPESAIAASKLFTAHPHVAGSAQSHIDALQILEIFQEHLGAAPPSGGLPVYDAGSKESRWATLGLTSRLGPRKPTAWVDTYFPVMDTGKEQRLEILDVDGKVEWTAELGEDGDPLDPDAHKYRDAVPTWHGASGDGDVQGQLIYANYATQEDYAELVKNGANFTGKIVLARYGAVLRGLKIKGAEDLGAVGLLMYSDPRDDGYITTENGFAPYPAGPARNPTAVQRGSVAYINLYPGDPTTPGIPAYQNANRTEGTNGPRIPSLPISWANAERLLKEIDGPYRALNGATSAKSVHLVNHVDIKVTPIWNAMAAIPGHIRDEVVVFGGHRDAWVLGAEDPISGTASMHEVVRGFGALLKAGWQPLRTIIFASWDAEEYGLIGSTEWGEDFAEWLAKHAVAYVNIDGSVGGSRWFAAASPSLSHLIAKTAKDVPHPTKPGKTLWDAQEDDGPIEIPANATADEDYLRMREAVQKPASNMIFGPLGSGSDFTVFLQRIGIASCAQAFDGTLQDAIYHYHSIYDSQRWQEKYADPGYLRATAVAQHLGLLVLRLTDSIIVPLNTTHYSLELHDYLDEVEAIVLNTRLEEEMERDFLALRLALDSLTARSIELDAEKAEAEREFLEVLAKMPKFPPGRDEFTRTGLSSESHIPGGWEEYLDAVHGPRLPQIPPLFKFIRAARRVTRVNKKLEAFERGCIADRGIEGRGWYRNKVVAPGRWKGYGATTFPELNEALAIDGDAEAAHRAAVELLVVIAQLIQVVDVEN
ncbi:Zn-dependent exopeptidase [Mycena kentingensis (nom. inval.)]|nr:Zn-dependent exopeptidase [Mycena kentingensis (nom. inval.)]